MKVSLEPTPDGRTRVSVELTVDKEALKTIAEIVAILFWRGRED